MVHCSLHTVHPTLCTLNVIARAIIPTTKQSQKTFATIKKAHCDDKNCVEDTVQVVFGEKPR